MMDALDEAHMQRFSVVAMTDAEMAKSPSASKTGAP